MTLKKKIQLEAEKIAFELWLEKFGRPGMSDEIQRIWISEKLVRVKKELAKS